jgi:hypothetical protein
MLQTAPFRSPEVVVEEPLLLRFVTFWLMEILGFWVGSCTLTAFDFAHDPQLPFEVKNVLIRFFLLEDIIV